MAGRFSQKMMLASIVPRQKWKHHIPAKENARLKIRRAVENQYGEFLIFAQKVVAVHEFNKVEDDFGISFHNIRFSEICSRCSKNS